MIYKGNKKGTIYHGDMHPASLYIGDKKVDGFTKETLKGQGQINWNSKYKASLPSVKISGKGEQETLRGVNMWTTNATFPLNNRPGTSYNEKTQIYTISTEYNIKPGGISQSVYHFDKPIPVGTKVSIQLFCLSGNVTGTLSFGGYHFIPGNPRSWQGYVTLPNNQDLTGKVLTQTFITTEEVTDLWFFLYSGLEIIQDVNFKVQYELGEPTPYEPYCGGTPAPNPYYQITPKFLENSKLECRGKNYYYSPKDGEINTYGIDAKVYKDKSFLEINGVGEKALGYRFKNYIELPAGEYTFSTTTNKKVSGFIFIYKENQDRISMIGLNYSSSFILDIPTKIGLGISLSEGETYNCIVNIQIEKGKVATPYEPHYYDKEINVPILRAIPTGVKDEIDFSTGTIIRRVKELVLDENDNYFGYTPRPDEPDMINQIYWAVPGYKHDRYRICCVSNIAQGGVIDERSKKPSIAFTWGQGLAINLPKSLMLCQQAVKNGEWKQFLIDQKAKGTPIKIWYELETPIIEHFNPEVIRQHPGYTELNQIDGISDIETTVYK